MTYSNSFNKLKPYSFVLLWVLFTALLQWLGKGYFRFESNLFSTGEIWRILSGHWVHLNWTHWLLNNLGLLMLVALLRLRWRISFWLKVIAIHSVLISLALLVFNPQLQWYVGFSGVLYGLYMLAALMMVKKDTLMSIIIIAIIFVKIAAEQWFGSEVSTELLLGSPVIVDAHAYGFLIGTILGVLVLTTLIKIK